MRVAMLGQYPLDERRIVGGIEAIMPLLLRGLIALGDLDVHVVTCQPGVQDGWRTTSSGTRLCTIPRHAGGRLTFHHQPVSALRRVLDELAPDIVHAQGVGIYSLAATSSTRAHVVTMHGIVRREMRFARGLPARLRGVLDRFYEQHSLGQIQNLIVISPYVEQELAQIGAFRGRLYRIQNPVDERFFTLEGSSDGAGLLYAGRVIPRKGLLQLLHALVQVRTSVPTVLLRVAGETEADVAYARECRRFVQENNLEQNVSFLGSLTVEQMAEDYRRCAFLVLPSSQETAPVVVAEVMAAGKPVVSTRACGMPFMVDDGASGLLLDNANPEIWAQAIAKLLSDSALRRSMGQRGRALATERFHPLRVAQATRAAYAEILEGV